MKAGILLLNMCFPVLAGLMMLQGKRESTEKKLARRSLAAMVIASCFLVWNLTGDPQSLHLCSLGKDLPVYFHVDAIGKLFASVVTLVLIL